jgi:hypothetical protein
VRIALRVQLVEFQTGLAVGKDIAGANRGDQFGLDLLTCLFGLGLCGGTAASSNSETVVRVKFMSIPLDAGVAVCGSRCAAGVGPVGLRTSNRRDRP